jgi:hypothetical protein
LLTELFWRDPRECYLLIDLPCSGSVHRYRHCARVLPNQGFAPSRYEISWVFIGLLLAIASILRLESVLCWGFCLKWIRLTLHREEQPSIDPEELEADQAIENSDNLHTGLEDWIWKFGVSIESIVPEISE